MSKTYAGTLSDLLERFNKGIHALGTCDFGVIDDIVDWVVRRDGDSSQKFWDAVRGGQPPYDALQDRLGHDQNALNLVRSCKAEAMQSLANHGAGG